MPAYPPGPGRRPESLNASPQAGVGPNVIAPVSVSTSHRAPTRERLVGLLFQARSELAVALERLGRQPSGSASHAARAIGPELDAVQRALTSVREGPEFDWAAVLRRLATVCTAELSGVRDWLLQAAGVAEGLLRNRRRPEDRH
jgi:hypothetical protein